MGTLNDGHGLIATLVRGTEVRVSVFQVAPFYCRGSVRADSGVLVAVGDLIRFCDKHGWKVRTISTPSTLLRDLRSQSAYQAERRYLGARLDLLETPPPETSPITGRRARQHRKARRAA